jgi:hypothetical protein
MLEVLDDGDDENVSCGWLELVLCLFELSEMLEQCLWFQVEVVKQGNSAYPCFLEKEWDSSYRLVEAAERE